MAEMAENGWVRKKNLFLARSNSIMRGLEWNNYEQRVIDYGVLYLIIT